MKQYLVFTLIISWRKSLRDTIFHSITQSALNAIFFMGHKVIGILEPLEYLKM